MKQVDIHVPIYDWTLSFIVVLDKIDHQPVEEFVTKNLQGFPKKALDEILASIDSECYNGGETVTSMSMHKAVVVIFKWSDESYFYNVLNHEKRHCVDNILEDCHIHDREAAAYLDGYISAQIHKQINNLK